MERFDDEILLRESETNLQYAVVGYNTSLYTNIFSDPNPITGHSPIVVGLMMEIQYMGLTVTEMHLIQTQAFKY